MRIVIDLQGAQTESRFRGIGRYSQSLALAIIQHAKDHDIWLVLNAAFPAVVLELRKLFAEHLPAERIQVFDTLPNVAEHAPQNMARARCAEKIREYFIQQLNPDIVLVTSLFEGYVDDAVTSIKTFSHAFKTAVILYDLIPLQYEATYLPTPTQKKYYFNKLESLKKADLLLAISDDSRNCAINLLSLSPSQVITISTGADPYFQPLSLTVEEIRHLQKKLGIQQKIILCVSGGFDARKNIHNLLIAYSKLPQTLKEEYQLVIGSKIDSHQRNIFQKTCNELHLANHQVIFTGYLSHEELRQLYNLSTLFVFPSLAEGFGLPVLEAMSCGTPTIGANNTSIPEVIGLDNALFDATSPAAIAAKMQQALTDEIFRNALKTHSIQQAKRFSWDIVARNALKAIEAHCHAKTSPPSALTIKKAKPRLAFISPLPPQQTGIATYSIRLLPDLTTYFDVDLIVDQKTVELPDDLKHLSIKPVKWFAKHGASYDKIIYQFGDSPFHAAMVGLLDQYPGIVVLHDFFLSGLLSHEEIIGRAPTLWTNALLYSHGYAALQSRFKPDNVEDTKEQYPCNLGILQKAKGIIVHSEYVKELATTWYGNHAADGWNVIPHLKKQQGQESRETARQALNIDQKTFLVCSFGFIDPRKSNHRLVKAWLASALSHDKKCQLVFVGTNPRNEYGTQLSYYTYKTNIHITGWCDEATYRHYLGAADLAIQLRTNPRGETSGAVLDCMSSGIATILNASGSMAEYPADTVWKLDHVFSEVELKNAIETLWREHSRRKALGLNAYHYAHTHHHPRSCALRYAEVIERIYQSTATDEHALIKTIGSMHGSLQKNDLKRIAQCIASVSTPTPRLKQILIDVSTIMKNDLKSGIQRVVRAQLLELIRNQPTGYKVEPVYLCTQDTPHYRYARAYTCALLELPAEIVKDAAIDIAAGDIFYAADFACYEVIQACEAGIFERWRVLGVKINVALYDLLPILKPEFFPPNADGVFKQWLTNICLYADRVIGISHQVTRELNEWLKETSINRTQPLMISAAPLGADICSSAPTLGLPPSSQNMLSHLKKNTCFLMVGTIEPRKGYLQALSAFEKLWAAGHSLTLVIVGKEGWIPVPTHDRRTIPDIIKKLTAHPERDKRLFWLNEVSDEYLAEIYKACTCLLIASEGEGFGLPIIEGANYHLPIIARDLPVFREIAHEGAYYFKGSSRHDLADVILKWLALYAKDMAPRPARVQWITWEQNAKQLLSLFTLPCNAPR